MKKYIKNLEKDLGTEIYRGMLRIGEFSRVVSTKAQVEEQGWVYILTTFQE